MGGRSGQSTGGGSGGGAALGSGVDSTNNYKDVNIVNSYGTNLTNKSPQEFLGLAGVPKDFIGDAKLYYYSKDRVYVTILNNGIHMQRQINLKDKTIDNNYFTIDKNSKYSGKSLEIFTSQVKEAKKQGFQKINVNAAGEPNDKEYNGYYTWAAYGYKPNYSNLLIQSIKIRTGRDYGTWETMMKSKQGRADWKANGQSWDGSFDLNKGSNSIKQLAAYTKDKKAKS